MQLPPLMQPQNQPGLRICVWLDSDCRCCIRYIYIYVHLYVQKYSVETIYFGKFAKETLWYLWNARIQCCLRKEKPPQESNAYSFNRLLCWEIMYERMTHTQIKQFLCSKKRFTMFREGSRMRHENSGASKVVQKWLSTRVSEPSDAQLSNYV